MNITGFTGGDRGEVTKVDQYGVNDGNLIGLTQERVGEMSKPFRKGQLARSVSHERIGRIEHMGVQGDVALLRSPVGPTTDKTWTSWLPLDDLRHATAIELLAELTNEGR